MRYEVLLASPAIVMICAATVPAVISFVAQWRGRMRNRHEMALLRQEWEQRNAAASESFEELRRGFLALEEAVRTAPEPPRAGGLNRSARAQALLLLRSGMSPDSAAASLGMGKREMRLLDKVSRTLYVS